MDRSIVYAGSLPLDTDILYPQQAAMVALAGLTKMVMGTASTIDGLAVTQSAAPNMSVLVASGSITALVNLEPNAYGAINADNTNQIVKIGVNRGTTTLGPFTAPGTAGQSVNILIQAAFAEADGVPVVLPYYNASNPAVPYSGPSNSGTAQNTRRVQGVTLAAKIGTAATTGSQVTPSADSGYVPVAVVTIANGASSIVNANISVHPSAPYVRALLPAVTPIATPVAITSSGTFTVPQGVTALRFRLWGAGAGGGGTTGGGSAGSGGGAGEYREGVAAVTPGQAITVTVGAAGPGGAAGGANNGTAGGDTSLGAIATAKGGSPGTGANAAVAGSGGAGGTGGSGGTYILPGGQGYTGFVVSTSTFKGVGGAPHGSGLLPIGANSGSTAGEAGVAPGQGGSGGINGGAGGNGAAGRVEIEY